MARNREDTQNRFLQAVIDITAENGIAALGINQIAQKAGADKVLIYRYFGDLEALLEQASLDLVLPENDNQTDWSEAICDIEATFSAEPYLQQIARARHAFKNPLTERLCEWFENRHQALSPLLALSLKPTGNSTPTTDHLASLATYAALEKAILGDGKTTLPKTQSAQPTKARKTSTRRSNKKATPAPSTPPPPVLEELPAALL